MSQEPSLPSYNVLTKTMKAYQPNADAAQTHGIVCGYICAMTGATENLWEKVFPEIKKNKKAYALLQEVLETSYCLLSEFSFEFHLILPTDKTDINIRAEALGLWCQGFLTGLQLGYVPIENREPGQVTEAIEDMIEISEIGFGDIAENDEDESAYFELVEYVRLSVLMIYHETKEENTTEIKNNDDNSLLH